MHPYNDTLSIAQKFKLLREERGITQNQIAELLSTNQGKISRIEQGKEEYADFDVKTLKEFYEIADMPLEEDERKVFKGRLYIWRDLIRNREIEKAEEMQNKFKNVVNLASFDFDLPTLYRLFEALLYIAKNDIFTASDILGNLRPAIDKMTPEHKYYFDFHMGSLYAFGNLFEEALVYYRKALVTKKAHKDVVPDSEEKIYYNLAVCYTELEELSRATEFLNKIPRANLDGKTTIDALGIDIMVATNYYKIKLYEEAEELLNDCLVRARIAENQLFIGLILQHLGIMHRYLENWEKAIEYFNQALDVFDENTDYYYWALYRKLRCMIGMRRFPEVEDELRKINSSKKIIDRYPEFWEASKRIMHLHKNVTNYNKNSAEYLKNTAIPFFIKNSTRFEALDCYKLVLRQEEKIGTKDRVIETSKAIYELLEGMM